LSPYFMLSKHLKELKGKAFLNNLIYIVQGKSSRLGHLSKYCSVTCIFAMSLF
jgi:hypothetical protein